MIEMSLAGNLAFAGWRKIAIAPDLLGTQVRGSGLDRW